MRIATSQDTPALAGLYEQATRYANLVGHIDWRNPFPEALVTELIETNELFCFESSNEICGVAKVSTKPDTRVWGNTKTPALYLSKVATSDVVRGSRFFERQMLPALMESFPATSKIRLDCLSNNERLKALYLDIGFTAVGEASFFSVKSEHTIMVTRFETQAKLLWVH